MIYSKKIFFFIKSVFAVIAFLILILFFYSAFFYEPTSIVKKVPKNQVPTSKYLVKVMDFFRQLLQKNIPEKNHVHLILETLRVARSDGTQHQVGSRWHQDHEAYFSLLINLTEYWDANSSTNFYHLEPNEKYKLNTLGNPILEKHWKKD